MIVKICGIQTIDDAQAAIRAGANWLGFVFAKSKRKVSPEQAQSIIQSIKEPIKTVGVFVNEHAENINSIVNFTGINIVQLHGDETPELMSQISVPTIKSFPIDQLNDVAINQYPSDYILIDSQRTAYYGGSGKTFDWNILQNNTTIDFEKLIVAGGLNPNNVQSAIKTIKPGGVDVSSGVETDGKKDTNKIIEFVKQVKQMRGVHKYDEL